MHVALPSLRTCFPPTPSRPRSVVPVSPSPLAHLLLFAEAAKAYIDSWVISWFCRHPMQVQKSADGYLQMLRVQGFQFDESHVSLPYLWWSRARDFGLLERWGLRRPGRHRCRG